MFRRWTGSSEESRGYMCNFLRSDCNPERIYLSNGIQEYVYYSYKISPTYSFTA
jgi:hypothetical protein